MNELTSRQGWSTCFCYNEIVKKGSSPDKEYDVWTAEGTKKVAICEWEWSWQKFGGAGSITYYTNSLLVVVYNLISRLLCIKLIKKIRFTSISAETQMILHSVFSVYFINYGVMYVVCPSAWNSV